MLPLLAAGAAISGVSSLIKTGIGLFGSNDGEEELKKLQKNEPTYAIPREWYDNKNITASMAQHGLSEPAINYYTGQAGRGLSSGLSTILAGGGSVNNVADLYDSYDTGINKISAADAETKNANIGSYIKANSELANEREKEWTLNDYAPWQNKMKAASAKISNGQSNFVGGIQDFGNVLTSASMAQNAVSGAQQKPDFSSDVIPNKEVFSTDAGRRTLSDLIGGNRNSPYMKSLLAALNQPQ